MNSGHDRFREQLPAYSLDALDPAERSDLEHHLEGCPECRAELDWLAPATEVLVDDVDQVEPSPDLKRNVMAAVEQDLRENPVAGDPASEEASDPSHGASRRKPRTGGGWLAGILRPAVLGAAAAALFLGVAIGVVVGGDDSPTGPERQVITGQSTIGADAVFVTSDGTGTLKLTGLKDPGEGQVYQAWVQRGQAIEPTDSLFVPDQGGSATASIPDLGGVSTIMVSVEPTGGSPQPTTTPVITVPLSS